MKYVWIHVLCLLSVFIGARCKVENLTISKDVVYRTNITVTLSCSFIDNEPPPDINLIWHHNDNPKPLVTGPPTLHYDSNQRFSYQLIIDNASKNDAGRYSCNVEGGPLVVSTTLTEVSVDDNPAVGEINSNLEFNLLSRPNPDVRCFTAHKPFKEAPGCKMNTNVTGLKVIWNDDNVTFVLYGDTNHLSDMKLSCFHPQSTIPLDVTKDDSATNDKTAFICNRIKAMSDLDVILQWKEKILYDKKVTETGQTSGSAHSQVTVILIVVSVMSKWLQQFVLIIL